MRTIVILLRTFGRRPLYPAVTLAILTPALAIMFGAGALFQGTLLALAPYSNGGELKRLTVTRVSSPVGESNDGLWTRAEADVLANAWPDRVVSIYGMPTAWQSGAIESAALMKAHIDERLLPLLRVVPVIGGFASADFREDDELPGCLVSFALWRARYGGDESVLGQAFYPRAVAGDNCRIAGVLPDKFRFPSDGGAVDVILPLRSPLGEQTRYAAITRVIDEEEREAIRRRLLSVVQFSVGGTGSAGTIATVDVVSLGRFVRQRERGIALGIVGLSAMLVILAAVNVSGLITADIIRRRTDWNLRRALGAGSFRLVRELCIETSVLTVTAAGCAIWLGVGGAVWVYRRAPSDMFSAEPTVSLFLCLFAVACSAAVVAIVTAWPAARVLGWSGRTRAALGGKGATLSKASDRFAIVAVEVAIALSLTSVGTLVIGSFITAGEPVGFETSELLMLSGSVAEQAENRARSMAEALAYQRNAHPGRAEAVQRALAIVSAIEGVSSAAVVDSPMLAGRRPGGVIPGDTYAIAGHFAATVRPQLVKGRWPTADELRAGHALAVVTEGAMEGRAALGAVVQGPFGPLSIVGIAAPARYASWDWSSDVSKQVYVPYSIASMRASFTLLVRLSPGARSDDVVRRIEAAAIPSMRFGIAMLADDVVARTIRRRQIESFVFSGFALIAIAVVAAGVGGLIASATSQRQREIGVRLATGASRSDVVRLLLREQSGAVFTGLGVGVVLALGALPIASPFLYGAAVLNPAVWLSAFALVLVVSGLAVLLPAYRMSATDPAIALKAE
jgi:putative ABC transport system permease protein